MRENYYCLPIVDDFEKYSKKILWPVYRWDVLIPEIEKDTLNAFERFFLELIGSSTGVDFELAAKLGIDKLIYERILYHLSEKKLIDDNNKITNKGIEILNSKDYGREEIMISSATRMSMFQDAITGKIIPFVCPLDIHMESFDDENDYIKLEFRSDHKEPSTNDIKKAIKDYYRCCSSDVNEYEMEFLEDDENSNEEYEGYLEDDDNYYSLADSENDDDLTEVEKTTVFRLIRPSEKAYILFHFSVNPLWVTNGNTSEIWDVITPFGRSCSQIIRNWIINLHNQEYDEMFADESIKIVMQMKDIVPFRNELDLEIFRKYPALTNDSKYKYEKKAIENLEIISRSIDKGLYLDDTWIMRFSNLIDPFLRKIALHISKDEKNEMRKWIENHKHDFKKAMLNSFDELNINYKYRDKNYINNPNITIDKFLSICNTKIPRDTYKKDLMAYMTVVTSITNNKYWLKLISSNPDIYERLSDWDYKRNKNGVAHYTETFAELNESDRKQGLQLLYAIISTYFEEVRRDG